MQIIVRLIFALLLFLLAACTDPLPSVAADTVEEEIPIAPPYVLRVECKSSVQPFWTKFRAAILKEDWEAVADMTEFPLAIRRYDGRKLLTRKNFAKHFPQFLNAALTYDTFGDKPKPTTMREYIKVLHTLDRKACGDFEEWLPIDHWQFFLGAEGWRLSYVTVNEFPASMNHIPVQP